MILLLSFLALLAGTFLLKNIRIGAVAGIIIVVCSFVLSGTWSAVQTEAILNGLLISAELSLLLFGAISFYEFLKVNDRLSFLQRFVDGSPGKPFLLIVFCFFLGSFFEGIAGFGVPAMLLIPILVNCGFKPITAVVCGLCGSFVAVSFGALGAPVVIGLAIAGYNAAILYILLLSVVLAILIPFLLTGLFQWVEGEKVRWTNTMGMLLAAGAIYATLFFITGLFTIEYPSVIAGALGMIIFTLCFNPAARKFGLPFWISSFWPYLLLVVLLLAGKFLLNGHVFLLKGASKAVSAYQPGLIFVITIAFLSVCFMFFRQPYQLASALKNSAKRLKGTTLTILLIVTFSQLIRSALVDSLSSFVSSNASSTEPFLFLLFGVSGSFITGSATMSNLLLVGLTGIVRSSVAMCMATLQVGSSTGNIISLQNIVMAKSVIHDPITEGRILKYTATALLVCLAAISIAALAWMMTVNFS